MAAQQVTGSTDARVLRGTMRAKIASLLFLALLGGVFGQNDDEWCDFNGGGTSACEWTGDCGVETCFQQCQIDPTLGTMYISLNDRAFDLDWWQLCPALARIVRLDKDYILDYTPTAPVPMASEEEDYLIEGDEEEDSGFSLFEGGATRKLQQQRKLQQTQFWNLTCPTPADVELVTSSSISFGLQVQNVLEAQQEGRDLTAEEAEFEAIQLRPNYWWTLLPFILEPASITSYMEANCTNMDLGGPTRAGRLSQSHFGSYHGDTDDATGHLGANDTFGMCVDTFGGYEAFARDDAIKDSVCIPSFDESPMCQAPINSVFYWPTTVPCADRLAELYRVDPEHTRAVHDIVLAAKKECELITSQAECESVPRQPYEQNITAVEEQMPLRILGNITLSSGSTPNDTDPVGTVESGQPTDDAGAAPGLGSDVESDSGSFGPAFPGLTSGQTADEEDMVTLDDLSAATSLLRHCTTAMLSTACMVVYTTAIVLTAWVL